MNSIDAVINRISIYRLVVYGLGLVSVVGIMLASIGRIPVSPALMILSFALLAVSSYATEWFLARAWQTPFNSESWLITALIIFLIFPAPRSVAEAAVVLLVGIAANASKYLLAWNGKHIFNPAAFGVALAGFLGLQTSTWWVGNSALWVLMLVVGLLIVRKIRRFSFVMLFVVVSIVLQAGYLLLQGHLSVAVMQNVLVASPLIFLSTIMLTEPATMPPRKSQQAVFAVIIAVLYVGAWKIGPLTIYPEIALLIGNVYAFAVSPKFKMALRLKEIQKISDQVYNFVFIPEKKFAFKPGQYMEWTLPNVAFDARGNRRAFTIASSPTEGTVQLGVKFYNPSSTYKYALSRMQPGDPIYASQLMGNFTLNGDKTKKIVFIAGGIGVTPFRSMIKYLTDTNTHCDIVLLYSVGKPEELAYVDEFEAAKKVGVTFVPILADTTRSEPGMLSAKLNSALLRELVPDYSERLFYVSGPDAMVQSTKNHLYDLDVQHEHIKTDYFSGY